MRLQLNIKGIGDGLLIHVPDGEWSQVHPEILATIDTRPDFFRGARVALDLANRELSAPDLDHLREDLETRGVRLYAVVTTSSQTRESATDIGLETEIKRRARRAIPEQEPFDTELLGEAAVLVERTVRSGHSLRHPGHVVVLGDVNPGAEIVAGGHVIVWGRLRGTVHAGAAGSEDAIVCALDLAPTQLRIAAHVATSPERKGQPRPEVARLRNGHVVAEYWRTSARQ
jgi:septum site-determining protein MinC